MEEFDDNANNGPSTENWSIAPKGYKKPHRILKPIINKISVPRKENIAERADISVEKINQPELKTEEYFEELNRFRELTGSEGASRAREAWFEKYGNEPPRYLDGGNFEHLKKLSPADRIYGLARASLYLQTRPRDAESYFKTFPEDLRIIKLMFEDREGFPETGLEHNLFGLSLPFIDVKKLNIPQGNLYRIRDYLQIAERRNLAPDFLLNKHETLEIVDQWQKEFGEAASGWNDTMREAENLEVRGDHVLDPSRIFTEAFENLIDKQKTKFLRSAIADVQFSLVFHETFNSVFTKERIDEDRERAKKNEFGKWDEYPNGRILHNVAHSMIFRTYQPVSVYEADQSHFDHEMNSTADIGGAIEEYPYNRILIALIKKLEDIPADQDENADLLVDLWNKNRNPIFGKAIADALSKQNPSRAAGEILELIRNEKTDRNALAAILYRLELGEMGISKEGVSYLGYKYDLNQYNNPDFFVQRLTAGGDMGIFSENRRLEKYFNLGDLSRGESQIKAQVLDFTIRTLFAGGEGETKEECGRRQKILDEFQEKYFSFYNSDFFKNSKIQFNNLSFREQGWYMFFVERAASVDKERTQKFLQKYGEDGFRTFLSLEQDSAMGSRVLQLGESLEPEAAGIIFASYSNLIDSALSAGGYIKENFLADENESVSAPVIDSVVNNLLVRGKDLLLNYAERLSAGEKLDFKKLRKELNALSVDQVLFLETFKSLRNKHIDVPFEAIKDVQFNLKYAEDLTGDEIEEMRGIYARNYEKYPELQKALLKVFEKAVRSDLASSRSPKASGLRRNRIDAAARFVSLCSRGDGTSSVEF